LGARRITGMVYYAERINSDRYVRQILTAVRQLTDEEKLYAHFQQDSALAHTKEHSMQILNRMFGEGV
jgi:hypothetical protein